MNNQNFNNSNSNTSWNNQTNLNPNNQNNGFNNQQTNIEMNNGVNNNQFTNINGSQNQNYYNGGTNNINPTEENSNNGFNNNYTNNNKSNSKNKKIIPIIVIALVVLVGIFGITKLFGGSSSGKGYTVSIGEELKIKELDGLFDFSIEVLSSVEKKHIVKEGIFDNDEYDAYAIKVRVKNYDNSDLELNDALLAYQLLDSADNGIEMLNPYDAFEFDDAIQTTISSGDSATGYLYFYDILADENSPEIDVNKVNKLEIGVLHSKNNNGVITGEYESYFVKLR